jgi:pyrimidine-specific ribonucleoside hydrolase
MKKKVIFDCDPGHDDAIAIILALACDDFEIQCLTVVGGNHTLEKVTRNALQILEVCGRSNIPVAMGRRGPFFQELILAEKFHGKSGMDGHHLDEPITKPIDRDAVSLMAEIIESSEEKVYIIATGPLSNIAAFILGYPHLIQKIECISIMGGSYYRGNWTAIAEFNVWIDPEAADVVFRSGIPFYLHGLDVTHKAYITREEYAILREINNPVANFVADLFDFFSVSCIDIRKHPGCLIHDACASACLINQSLFEYRCTSVVMDLYGKYSKGGCLIDMRPGNGVENSFQKAMVAVDVKRETFVQLVIDSCRILGNQEKGNTIWQK